MVLQSTGHAYSVLRAARQPNAYLYSLAHGSDGKIRTLLTAQEDEDEVGHFNANGLLFHASHYDLVWSLHDAMLTTGYREVYGLDLYGVLTGLCKPLNTTTRLLVHNAISKVPIPPKSPSRGPRRPAAQAQRTPL